MKTKKIKDLYFFQPKSKIKAGDGMDNGEFPFYTSSTILKKRINEKQFNTSSLVFGTGGNASIHFASGVFSVSTDCLVASSKQEELNIKYTYYYILSNLHLLQKGFKGAGLKHISKSYIENLEISYPEIDIQNRIVAVLDSSQSLINKREKIVLIYESMLESIFIQMFGDPYENPYDWEVKEFHQFIKYIGDIGSNGSNKIISQNLKMSDEEDYATLVRTTNLSLNDFKNKVKYISKESYDFFEKSKIYGDDFIMNKIGSPGDFWVMPELNKKVSLGFNLFVIRPKNIEKTFLYYYLSSEYLKTVIKAKTRGAAVKSITKKAVKELPVFLPPIDLQKKFANRVQVIEKLKSKNKQSLTMMRDLFDSLSQLAFDGELKFNAAVDLEILMENDYAYFRKNANIDSIKLLLERLDKGELNANKFYEQELYDKAKKFVFELLNDKKIEQVYDNNSKRIKLSVK